MRELEIWRFLQRYLEQGQSVALLIVVDSQGSSPGRLGFKMVVAADGQMQGSIGGGIMEHKLVAWAMDRLYNEIPFWEIKRQIHSKEAPQNQSGMICSGEQTIAMLSLSVAHLAVVSQVIELLQSGKCAFFSLDQTQFTAKPDHEHNLAKALHHDSDGTWQYSETLGWRDIAHVIGAGHVGLEMSKILAALDFRVINYDDRANLNTLEANAFAHNKIVTPYSELGNYITGGPNVYVIIMTFGYRGDDEAVRALLDKKFAYFGMMGSQTKVTKLLADLKKDGFAQEEIARLTTPAGLISHCKSPAEIAISIAAEMIQIRNKTIQ